jgi:uncharacterized protein
MAASAVEGGTMSEQQNLDTVRRAYEAFGRGDIDALLSTLHDNVEWTTPGPAELATAGTRRGKAEVRAFFGQLVEVFEITRFEPKSFIAQGDMVIVLGEDTARVRASGGTVDEAWAHAFTLKNGVIVNFHEYMDMSAVAAELRSVTTKV